MTSVVEAVSIGARAPLSVRGDRDVVARVRAAYANETMGATPVTQLDSGSALARALAGLVGDDHVLQGDRARPYETDATAYRGLRGIPDAVVLPGSAEELAAVTAWCYERGVEIVPRGGGSGLAGGAVPIAGGVVIATERLDGVRELVPEEWRMTVEAGVTTAQVHRLARENGLFFPPDPGAAEQSHVGGNVATNAGGPHAFKYGATAAWVSGVEAVMAPGEIASFGGAVRKDVGGYDIKSLLVGSEGTLGVITAVTLRLLPAPEATLPVVAFYADAAAGAAAVAEVFASGLQPAALDYLDGVTLRLVARACPVPVPDGAQFVLVAEVDGPAEDAHRQRTELIDVLGEGALMVAEPRPADLWRWRDGVSGTVATERGGKVSEDIVVPWSRLDEAIARITEIGDAHQLPSCSWGHAGDGNVHASFLIDPQSPMELITAGEATEELFAMAIELGGAVTGEHGVGYLKRGQLARQWDEPAVRAHEAIKAALDPKGLLNPGKKAARGG